MAESYNLGRQGEEDACQFLQQRGFKIRARNWRFKKAEIDLVAECEDYLVMVEVKTRTADTYGSPEEFVSRRQQRQLIAAANHYVDEHPTHKELRFDVIAITHQPRYKIEHIPEAFYP